MSTYLMIVLAVITAQVVIGVGAFVLMTNARFCKWMSKKMYKATFEICKEMEEEFQKVIEES